MRRYLMSLVGAFLFLAVLVVSCSQRDDEFDDCACEGYTLSESVSFSYEDYKMKRLEFWFDGELLRLIEPDICDWNLWDYISFYDMSDTTVRVTIKCDNIDGKSETEHIEEVEIYLRGLELKGELFDVTFDSLLDSCSLYSVDTGVHNYLPLHVKGWMRNITHYSGGSFDQNGELVDLDNSEFMLDMTISGEIDGKEVLFKLDSIKAPWKY